MKFLPPQRLRSNYYESVQEEIVAFYWRFLFEPLIEILKKATVQADNFENTAAEERALQLAIRAGKVQYRDGVFFGEFDAKTSGALRDMGAEFHVRDGVFVIADWALPTWVKTESVIANVKAKRVHEELERQMQLMQERLNLGQMELSIDATQPVAAIEGGFKSAADAIGIVDHLPPAARKRMEQRYQEDVRPYVVESTSKFIDDLRKIIKENAEDGYRYDHLVGDLQSRYGITQRKARFIARQETALFMAAYRRERFAAAGVTRYKWSTSHDERVRPEPGVDKKYGDHKILDKQIFYYETKAPAKFMSTGHPENPGEDFQCRCVDLAVLE